MNEVIKQIKERKSVRVFEDKQIEAHLKDEILNSAFQAPTAGGMMIYSILDITDQELKTKLAVACDNQPFIAKAPLVLIFLADYQRWYDCFKLNGCNPRKPGQGDILLAASDALIAAQNTVVAAESLGIGSCYIGDILENCEVVRGLLNLPEFVIPVSMLVYGYPTKQQRDRKKPIRFEKEYVVYENEYRGLTKAEHDQMHKIRNEKTSTINKNVAEDIKALCKRKYMSDFSLEMDRSVGKYLKKFRAEK